MVLHSQFARDHAVAGRQKLWDPVKTLEILNTDSGYESVITCVGYAPSKGRRCLNRINKDNREFIMETLNDMAYLRPNSAAVLSRLEEISGPALCLRYHQGQADTIVQQWQRKIRQLNPQIPEQKSAAKSIGGDKKNATIKKETIEDLQAQLQELKEQVEGLRRQRSEERDRKTKEQEEEGLEKERLEKERLGKERLEKERLEKERLEKERLEKERLERERLEKERLEKEQKKQREREQAAQNERIRQRAQKVREEREREKRAKEEKEREEWDLSWKKYVEKWVRFRSSGLGETSIRDAVPWPVKSGLYRDVNSSSVKEFLQKAGERDGNMSKLMRKECQKWHPDMIQRILPASRVGVADQMMLDMICRVVTDLLNNSAGRSSDFLS